MIRGARHFMSADEAFSEFDLVKTGPQDNPLLTKTKEILDSASRGQDDKQTPDKVFPSHDPEGLGVMGLALPLSS